MAQVMAPGTHASTKKKYYIDRTLSIFDTRFSDSAESHHNSNIEANRARRPAVPKNPRRKQHKTENAQEGRKTFRVVQPSKAHRRDPARSEGEWAVQGVGETERQQLKPTTKTQTQTNLEPTTTRTTTWSANSYTSGYSRVSVLGNLTHAHHQAWQVHAPHP